MIYDEFMKPEVAPDIKYHPTKDVIAWRKMIAGLSYLEVFQRSSGLFGFRYQAWVAWRDATDEVRSHSWHRIDPQSNLVTDSFSEATQYAEADAEKHGLTFSGAWCRAS